MKNNAINITETINATAMAIIVGVSRDDAFLTIDAPTRNTKKKDWINNLDKSSYMTKNLLSASRYSPQCSVFVRRHNLTRTFGLRSSPRKPLL